MGDTVICVTSSGDLLGGAERCLADVATRLDQYGWRPVVVAPARGALANELAAAGVAVRVQRLGVLGSRRELRSPRLLLRLAEVWPAAVHLAQVAVSARASLIHSNTSVVLAGALAARLSGRPHVWHVRELLGGFAWRGLRAAILGLSDRVLCISSAVADNLVPATSRQRAGVVVLPDGVDLSHFTLGQDAPQTREARPARVAMVARVNPWKGHRLFLQVASQVARQVPDAEFLLVGGHLPDYAPLCRDLSLLAQDLGLEGHAHFLGHLDRPSLRDLMASLDVLVLPSVRPEPGGLVLLEAMALRRAVVATRHGGPLEVIQHGVNGLLVSPTDPDEMAEAVVGLLADAAWRQELGAAARRRVEERYSLTRHLEGLTAIYGSLVTGSRK